MDFGGEVVLESKGGEFSGKGWGAEGAWLGVGGEGWGFEEGGWGDGDCGKGVGCDEGRG